MQLPEVRLQLLSEARIDALHEALELLRGIRSATAGLKRKDCYFSGYFAVDGDNPDVELGVLALGHGRTKDNKDVGWRKRILAIGD